MKLHRNAVASARQGEGTSLARTVLRGAVKRWMEGLETRRLMALVATDQGDYQFGETAHITGAEFAPNEAVQLQVTHATGTAGSNADAQNAPWVVEADAEGSIVSQWIVDDPDALGATYTLTARGLTSGESAFTNFTDGTTDIAGWANLSAGANKWSSSTLNGNTSSYNEGQIVPFRFTDLAVTPGSTHTVLLQYDFSNSQGVHMFDFLGSYDATVAADLTVGVASPGTATTWAIPTDTSLPANLQSAGVLTTHNISSLTIGPYVTSGDRRGFLVTYTVESGGASKNVIIGFGAHLARDFHWGTNKGASDFPGGSGKVYASYDGGNADNAAVNPGQVVVDVNDPPVAVNDSATTPEDTFVDINVIANDTDVDTANSSLTVAAGSIGNVVGGTAVLQPDGKTIRFTPAPNANNGNTPGGFSFTYRTTDGSLTSGNAATVTVSVTAVNDPPVAVDDTFNTNEDTPIGLTSGQLTANDTDVDNAPGDLAVTAVSNPTNGTVTLSSGQINFTPTAGFSGIAGFDYTVSDGAGGSDVGHVTINVGAINDGGEVSPTAGALLYTENDGAVAIDPGVSLSDADSANFVGATVALTGYVNGQDVLGFTDQNGITGSFNATTGVLTLTGTATVADYQTALRSVTYTNTSEAPSSAARTAVFTVDDGSATASGSRGITVVPVNDAPVNGLPGPQSTNEDTTKVFSSANGNAISISDVDAGSGIVEVVLGVTHGTLTLGGTTGLSFSDGDGAADASMTFTGTIAAINAALNGLAFAPALNYTGPATLTITTNDQGNSGTGGAQSDTDALSITINAVNDAPVAAGQSVTTAEDTSKQITLVATDVDDVSLTYEIVTGPQHGTLTEDSSGVYTYTPAENYNGPDSFTFKANDGDVDSNTATVTINVTPVNDAPTATSQSVTTNEDTAKVITLTGADIDGDSIDFVVKSLPAHGSLYVGSGTGGHLITASDVAGGGYTISGSTVTYVPALDYFGSDSFNFVSDDGQLQSAAATVSITVLDKTGPVITLGGSIGTEHDGQTQAFTWSVTDPSGLDHVLVTVTQDGNSIFSTSAASGTFNFDSDGLGDFEITVSAQDNAGNSSNAARAATVIDDDTAGPSIVVGGSTGSENDGQTQSFNWAISDPSGLSAISVVITQDGDTIYSTTSLADATKTFNFDSFGLGNFQINISATDNDGDRVNDTATATASRSVTVTDDDSAGPSIVLGGSQGSENDGQSQGFTWNVSDPSGLSALSVVIKKDGSTIFSTSDVSDAVGSYDFDSAGLGVFTIEVSATDNDSDRANDTTTATASRSVTVTDDDSAGPSIVLGGSQGSENDGQPQGFTWNVSDPSGLSALSVVIKKDGATIFSTTDVGDAVGSYDFDSAGLGVFTIEVSATDNDSDRSGDTATATASRSVTVTDDDAVGPTIILGGSQGSENDGQSQGFTWNVSDPSGLSALSVVIKKDGATIFSTSDVGDAVGSYDFDSAGLGVFTIEVSATDNDSDRAGDAATATASRSVTVTDDDAAQPAIVLGGSQNSETDGDTNHFTWNISDPGSGLGSISVVITRDDGSGPEVIFSSTNLADAVDGLNFDSLGLGTYVINVSATDADADRPNDALTSTASRTVVVSDDDVAAPQITLGGSQGTQNDGQSQVFTWDVTDSGSGLAGVTVTITKDGDTIHTSSDASGSFDFNGQSLGVFAIQVSATDNDNDRANDSLTNSASRTVTVTDDDATAPIIVLGGSTGAQNDGQTQVFTWDISDAGSGLASLSVVIRKDGDIIFQTSDLGDAVGSYNFDSDGLGVFTIEASATDADADRPSDSLSQNASRSATITDDDDAAPTIVLGGSQNTENDGQNQNFTWSVTDLSGLDSVSVVVTRNGASVFTSSDASGNFNFNTDGLGDYEISVTATDADNDRVNDSLTSNASRSVTVVDDDVDGPAIVLGGSQGPETDAQPQTFTWNISDPSGLSAISVVIKQDGDTIFSTTDLDDAVDSFDFNGYGLGVFTISVSATDNDGDRTGDTATSTASRSATVTDDDTAAPVIVLGGSSGNEDDSANNHFTWSVTDAGSGLAGVTVTITKDGGTIHTSSDASGSFDFNGHGTGVFQISVSATDNDADRPNDALSDTKVRSATVADDDIAGPAIVLGGSTGTETDGVDNHFTWNVSDPSGLHAVTVTIKKNGNQINSFTTASGEFDFNALGLGTYEVTVGATDNDNDWDGDRASSSQTRTVTVTDDDTDAPTVVLGGSTGTQNDGQTNAFSWDVADLGSGLDSFVVTITRNGTTIFSTTSQASGSFNFDDKGVGTYAMNVSATDADTDWTGDQLSNSASRSVVVTDDDTDAPTIVLGGSQNSENDGQDNHFTWNVTDASGLSEVQVTIRKNGNVVDSFTTASGEFDLNSLGLGDYEITVSAADNDNDWTGDISSTSATRSVTVTDDDVAGPSIVLGGSNNTETDGADNHFTWGVTDASGLSNVVVTVKKNGNVVDTFTTASGEFNFNSLGLGTYEISVSAADNDNDWSGDISSSSDTRTVVVTDDDTTKPTIVLGGSQTSENDGQDQHFTWDVSDASGLDSVLVTVTKNGSEIFSTAALSGSFDFNSFGLGDYEITVAATDNDNDWSGDQLSNNASRSVTVGDDDNAPPQIVLGGSQGSETDGDDNHFTWNVTDASGLSSLTLTIKHNGDIIHQTTDTADAIGSFNLNTLGLGTYEVSVSATDADNDWTGDARSASASRTVTVTDDDATAPVIVLGGSTGAQNDGQTQVFTWDISDAGSGLASLSVVIRKDGDIIFQTTDLGDAVGSYNFDSDGLGVFTIEASATDADADRTGDSLSQNASRTATITDDDDAAPSIVLGGSQGTQNDGQDQTFEWSVSDPSGLDNVSVTVKRNGSTIFTGSAADSSFDFNSFGVGSYELIVSARDNDDDRANDKLTAVETRTVTVSDDDTAPPSIVLGGSTGSETDGANNHFTWNVTDASDLAGVIVTVRKDGDVIDTFTVAGGNFDLNSLGLGTYQITVSATDVDTDWTGDQLSNLGTRSVTVTDDDVAGPVIVITGSQGSENDGQTQEFNWNVTDTGSGLSALSIVITQDGNTIFSTTDLGQASGSFNFNGDGLGEFKIQISATDNDTDWAGDKLSAQGSRSVTVTDDDTTIPQIVLGGSQGSQSHGLTQAFTWNVTDASGLSGVTVTVRKDGNVIYSGSSASGSYNFDAHNLGTFVIEVSVTDGDNDRTGDALSDTQVRQVVVTNATPDADAGADKTSLEGQQVSFSGAGSSDPDGEALQYFWDFGDGSTGAGLTPVHTFADDGAYTVTLTVRDGFGKEDTDTLTVTVGNVAPKPNIAGVTQTSEGTQVNLTSTVDDPGADTHTYLWEVVASNGQVIANGTGPTFSFVPNDNGTYTVTLTATDDHDSGTDTHVVMVSNVNPVAANNSPQAAKQYSDFIVPVTVSSTDASSVDVLTAQIVSGLPANSGLSLAWDNTTRSGVITGKANLAPGLYNVKVRVTDDDGGISETIVPINVTQEDALATYNGVNYVSTPSVSSNTALVTLRATIQDITKVFPGQDANGGDIRNATVKFVVRNFAGTIVFTSPAIPVTLINQNDVLTGVASYDWTANLGSANSESYTVSTIVGNYYTRNSSADDTVVTVSRPIDGFITGGGYLINESSAGFLAGEIGLKTNFGYNVKFNKSGTSLQGNVNIIVRSYRLPNGTLDTRLHVYQLKSNAISSLSTWTDANGVRHATFVAKANVQDITDPLNPISIAGGLSLEMNVTDAGEPGSNGTWAGGPDTIGFTLWKGSDLMYSSFWTGSKTVEDLLDGGNVQVHTLSGSRR